MTAAVVTDSTVLIYLAKLGELRLLDRLFDDVTAPAVVYEEVVTRGREERYADALAVDEAADGFLAVTPVEAEGEAVADRADSVRESAGLGRGESAAIALALARDARCLTDDHAARTTAESLGVAVGGTIFVLLEALDAGVYSFEEYRAEVDALTENGFRMDAALYRQAVEAGREIADGDGR